MKNIDLKIEGMHCDGCAKRPEKVLNNILRLKREEK